MRTKGSTETVINSKADTMLTNQIYSRDKHFTTKTAGQTNKMLTNPEKTDLNFDDQWVVARQTQGRQIYVSNAPQDKD
jgi:hypothetical protein